MLIGMPLQRVCVLFYKEYPFLVYKGYAFWFTKGTHSRIKTTCQLDSLQAGQGKFAFL